MIKVGPIDRVTLSAKAALMAARFTWQLTRGVIVEDSITISVRCDLDYFVERRFDAPIKRA